MAEIRILWADDEIELLKPHIIFLKGKGYSVTSVTNGHDAVDEVAQNVFDIIFLDESMPGMTGLETLSRLREYNSTIPVVMITKNEAENVMEEAIGSQISDYLIKPVNPNQILLSLKKNIDNQRLIQEKTTLDYQQDFRQLLMDINSNPDFKSWVGLYKRIIDWELKLDDSNSVEMNETLSIQKQSANAEFSKYIERNYLDWLQSDSEEDVPVMSHNLMRKKILPTISEDRPTIMVLLDNCRYDQWKVIEPLITSEFRVTNEDYFYSILPTSTQYSRNAIFAGMMPADIAKFYPRWWLNDNEEGGKNMKEEELLGEQINRLMRKKISYNYNKVVNQGNAKNLVNNIQNCLNNNLTVIVYNFIDMLSHARTEMEVLKELARDESAYRSLTKSWFIHSPLWEALKKVSDRKVNLIVTTDHGTIRVKTPSKVIGDKDTTSNLRYKLGRNLRYNEGDVLGIRNPDEALLPRPNISSSYIFAKEDKYFLYPNNYNYYNNYYNDTFQHGGISLEEIICPIITLESK